MYNTKEQILGHLKTHTKHSEEDNAAITTLKSFFKNDGKIKDTFTCDDKWPNHDGTIELVPNPTVCRQPYQTFYVQIKGTNNLEYNKNGNVQYRLQSLAFPAFSYQSTFDPCLLFVVFNSTIRGRERVFYKYMSSMYLRNIDFSKSSFLIEFEESDEIKNTDESIEKFVENLIKIIEIHSFTSKLTPNDYNKDDIISMITDCNRDIVESIDRLDIYNETRDNISRRMLTRLEDLCAAVLLLNAYNQGYTRPTLKEAWECALLNINSKYLATFLQRLRYIARRIPAEGQSERLMVQYYDFLWQIRNNVKSIENILILQNLEKFPRYSNTDNEEYYKLVAKAINDISNTNNFLSPSRYYVQKKEVFYVDGERYYEITLQLAGVYATKYNRLTVYTKQNISTNYSIQICYEEKQIALWKNTLDLDINTSITIVTNWRVAIDPAVLNKFNALISKETRMSSQFGEYNNLMAFLTKSGINLLDLIDFSDAKYNDIIDTIFSQSRTHYLKDILDYLHLNFSANSTLLGRNVIRYVLLNLREDIIDDVKLKKLEKRFPNDTLQLSSKCCPFESNPVLYNLPKHKTTNSTLPSDIVRTIGLKGLAEKALYLRIKYLSESTGEVYIQKDIIGIDNIADKINDYNKKLKKFDREHGNIIIEEDEYVYIEDYEDTTLKILRELVNYSKTGNGGQLQLNKSFIKANSFDDELKKSAIENAFIDSKVLFVYGAAGTGKTELINNLSNLMTGRSKLFLAKTHTATENLNRRIQSPGPNSDFMGIDQFLNQNSHKIYDIVFIDECSIIDNRTMMKLLKNIDNNSLLVLVGDIYQIESIEFGNWFLYSKDIIKKSAIVELTSNWRTDKEKIKNLWNAVRNRDVTVPEILVIDGPFSEDIDKSIFTDRQKDEIVLCLNYDGHYGLNNINKYFQDANSEEYVTWHEWKYKKGDPILFNDNRRFFRLYNNLKGRIVDIVKYSNSICFTIDVETNLTEMDARLSDFEFIKSFDNSTRIKIYVYENDGGTTDEERENAKMKSIVPFQIAYAVSIHKAQGLEYNSVKIVIPSSNSELISHGIFYTAITRTKEKLKIFWNSDTMKKVTLGFQNEERQSVSLPIIKRKLNENIND